MSGTKLAAGSLREAITQRKRLTTSESGSGLSQFLLFCSVNENKRS